MRIITPEPVSLIHSVAPSLPWAKGDGPVLCLGLLAGFVPRQDMPAPLDCLADEETLWRVIGECLPEGEILDEGLPKPRSEFLAYGDCHAANPVLSMECSIQVGRTVKRLTVAGDRFSQDGFVSGPKPFTSMGLTRANALGGPGHPFNPEGKGYGGSGLPFRELPNILDPTASSSLEEPDALPAGFGPLPVNWPARRGLLGPLDDAWLRTAWPSLPMGTSPEFACRAPAGQRMTGYFEGGEPIAIRGLHPGGTTIQGSLPRLRARLFIAFARPGGARPFEIACVMETLWLFPGVPFGALLFRGSVPVGDEECEDVAGIMAVLEDAALPPVPERERLRAFEEAMAGEAREARPPEADAGIPLQARAHVPRPAHPAPPAAACAPSGASAPDPAILALRKQVEELERDAGQRLREAGLNASEARRFLDRSKPDPGPAGAEPATLDGLKAAVERLREEAAGHPGAGRAGPDALDRLQEYARQGPREALAKHPGAQGVPSPPGSPLDRHGIPPGLRGELEQALRGYAEIEAALSGLEAMASSPAAPPDSPGEGRSRLNAPPGVPAFPGEPLSTEQAKAILTEGGALAHRDLTRCDLSGMNLTGVDLRDALLPGVAWKDVNLSGASMSGVMADNAVFQDCVLDGANLDGASLESVRLAGCSLKKCSARRAQFQNSVLSGCDLSFSDLAGADFTGALLAGASCIGVAGQGARLHDADLRQARFQGADLSESRASAQTTAEGADFSRAALKDACWGGASLPGARLRDAVLDGADLSGCDLRGASLDFAQARGAVLDKALLSRADLTGCNLFQASLRRSDLSESTVRHANLFGADLYKCRAQGAAMNGANLGRTVLDGRGTEDASG